jgi:NADH-quinone oxidoreductase subunit G
MRVVPRENESINETWIADRDRFSYEAVYSADRIERPMLREGSEWVETDWETALAKVATGLRSHAALMGVLASSTSTVEELYLLGRLARALGTNNIDHRLRQRDFRDQVSDPAFPSLGMRIADIQQLEALLVVGSHLRHEVPILAHRVRKAARKGAKVALLNPAHFPYLFPVAAELVSRPAQQVADLAAILAAAAEAAGKPVPEHLAAATRGARIEDSHRAIAAALATGSKRAVWLGALAARHPSYADLRSFAAALAEITGASFGQLAEGGNGAGAYLAGAIPHREAGGKAVSQPGLSAADMLRIPQKAYVLFGGVEPWSDGNPEAAKTLAKAELVVAITPFASEQLRQVAHVLLPIGTFAETSGSYVNLEGVWQSQTGAAQPVGESRPGWKVLRVLGNLLDLGGFDYPSSEAVRDELRGLWADDLAPPGAGYKGAHRVSQARADGEAAVVDVGIYQTDALVRRAPSLQKTRDGRTPNATY